MPDIKLAVAVNWCFKDVLFYKSSLWPISKLVLVCIL